MKTDHCPCGSKKDHKDCCTPFVSDQVQAPSPEALMRSRYTAFVNKDVDYLLATLAPEKKNGQENRLKQELSRTFEVTRWLGLRVLETGFERPDRGFVEFVAFFDQDQVLGQLHEHSVFIRENGTWYYLDGKVLPKISIGRNQPCVCGSGQKFKRCHGRRL